MSDPGDEDNENDTMMTTRVISAGIMKQTRHTLLVLVLSQGIVSQSVIGHVSGRDRRVVSREGGVRGGNCCYCTG